MKKPVFIFAILFVFGSLKMLYGQEASSSWSKANDRVWVGSNYWANPMENWQVANGRLECISGGIRDKNISMGPNVQLLTWQATKKSSFVTQVTTGKLTADVKGWTGFLFGIKGGIDDYRHACNWGIGIEAGLSADGKLFIEEENLETASFDKEVTLELSIIPVDEESHKVTLSILNSDKSISKVVASESIRGNIGITAHVEANKRTPTYYFKNWTVSGEHLSGGNHQNWGPILWTQYTLSKEVMKLTALLAPLGDNYDKEASLEIKKGNSWVKISKAAIDAFAATATFRIEKWDDTQDTPYRVAYKFEEELVYYNGTIRKDPKGDHTLKVAGFTGNMDYVFPNIPIIEKLERINPDMLFFSGDQIYEQVGGFGVMRNGFSMKQSTLNYLRKYYLFGWAFGDLMRDRPTVILPDDHDVFVGNVWGHNGRPIPKGKKFSYGGYLMSAQWVNMVQRTQTAHMPDPIDPEPIDQGIGVYFTDMRYGEVSFAIIEDRKFKWGSNSPEALETPEKAEMLGERQLDFLEQWASDWSGVNLKCVLSATVFAQAHTTQGANKVYMKETDANAWPMQGRNIALKKIRKGFAFMYAGDNHLPTLVQHGVEDWRDAGFSFTVPSIAAGFPRAWLPKIAGKNREQDAPEYTGDNFDLHGNKITMWAAANPVVWTPKAGNLEVTDKKSSGYGLVEFDSKNQNYTIECWKLLGNLDDPKNGQFEGWPKTISIYDNYAKKPYGWLPEINTVDFPNPVIQVENEKTGEIIYTIRVLKKNFAPMVFEKGNYTVRVIDSENGREKVMKKQVVKKMNSEN